MPMMRRGPLARYDAEWVLRQASASGTSGSIEFHTEAPLTLFLRNGRVCDAVEGTADAPPLDEAVEPPLDEAVARSQVLDLVARAMAATDGWYYLDPIGHQSVGDAWSWDAASLILDARIRNRVDDHRPDEGSTLAAPQTEAVASAAAVAPAPGRRIELRVPDDDEPVTLSAEAWRIVGSMATTQAWDDLRTALDWPPARLDAALAELDASGLLGPGPTDGVTPAATPAPTTAAAPSPLAPTTAAPDPATPREPASRVRAATPGPAIPSAGRALPPTVPTVPVTPGRAATGRRRALRRLISTLKPA